MSAPNVCRSRRIHLHHGSHLDAARENDLSLVILSTDSAAISGAIVLPLARVVQSHSFPVTLVLEGVLAGAVCDFGGGGGVAHFSGRGVFVHFLVPLGVILMTGNLLSSTAPQEEHVGVGGFTEYQISGTQTLPPHREHIPMITSLSFHSG